MITVYCPDCGAGYRLPVRVKSVHLNYDGMSARFEDVEVKHNCEAA